jgi:hypothetical protein
VRQWIRERRANAQTLAKAEDATEWRPLIAFAEFADALAAQTGLTPPPPVPPTASVDPDALAEEVLRRDYRLIIGDCFSRAWRTLTENFWPIVGVSALVGLILFFTNMVYVGIILTGPLVGGLYMYYLKSIRGERATMEDAFSGFTLAFVQLMLASIVSGLLTCLGVLAFVLPGIYLAVAWSLTYPIVIDKRIGFWEAMEVSRKVVSRHWWTMLLLWIVIGLVNIVGALCCGVGMFVAAPLGMLALMYAYEDIFRAGPTAAATAITPMAPGPTAPAPASPGPAAPAPPTPPPPEPPADTTGVTPTI